MNKFNSFLADHGTKIVIALLVLVYFKSCSINSEVDKVKKDLRAVEAEIDTLNATVESTVITTEEMKDLIKTIPAWNTLRIEEMSDKERISINAIKAREEGYDK
jgi:predicted  nucleic acid-binding Zn-ribbon protein